MSSRFQTSRLLSPVKALMRTAGLSWALAVAVTAGLMVWSTAAIVTDVLEDGPVDHSWSNFMYIAKLWFIFNVATMLLLALLEGPTWFVVGPKAPKFELFPLFSWQTPAIQQAGFFWPCTFYLLYAVWNDTPYYQFPAHGVASLFGQQARELFLFNSDTMMVQHHIVTMFLSAYIWWGMQGFGPDAADPQPMMVALNSISVAALEAGGLGVCLWSMFETGPAFYFLMSFSHVVCLAVGWYCIWLDPSVYFFYVTFVLSIPLIKGRQSYMLTEVSRGVPTGGFEKHRFENEGGIKDEKTKKSKAN